MLKFEPNPEDHNSGETSQKSNTNDERLNINTNQESINNSDHPYQTETLTEHDIENVCSNEQVVEAAREQEERIFAASLQGWAATGSTISIGFGFAASATVVALTYFGSSARATLTSGVLKNSYLQLANVIFITGWLLGLILFSAGAIGCVMALRRATVVWPDGEGIVEQHTKEPYSPVTLIRQRESNAKASADAVEIATSNRYRILVRSLGLLIASTLVALTSMVIIDSMQIFMPKSSVSDEKPKPDPAKPANVQPIKTKPIPGLPKPTTGKPVNLSQGLPDNIKTSVPKNPNIRKGKSKES